MLGIEVGVEQADGYRRGIQPVDAANELIGGLLGQRHGHGAVAPNALGDTQSVVTGDQRGGHLRIERVDLAAVVAADLQDVLETCGGDKYAFRQLAFEHGVGGNRGSVQQIPDIAQREAIAAGCLFDAGQEADRRVFGRRQRLQAGDGALAGIEDLQIRERAADIDGDPDRCATLSHVHGTLGSPSLAVTAVASPPFVLASDRFLWLRSTSNGRTERAMSSNSSVVGGSRE